MDVRAEKEGEFIELFDIYGELLTDNQKDVCKAYLEYDLSLGEIAENKGISRQSVSDCLKKSCNRLKEFEKTLGLIALKKSIAEKRKCLQEAFSEVERAEGDLGDKANGYAALKKALNALKQQTESF